MEYVFRRIAIFLSPIGKGGSCIRSKKKVPFGAAEDSLRGGAVENEPIPDNNKPNDIVERFHGGKLSAKALEPTRNFF
ncbi:hypothetical protein L484_009664 [Morus notabilis]|uniref:Uncharacterized protein n=1 Tax=Morus notabilis TaxID=981085 RepID=W9S2Y8_9ROSA|nr:hypothetical protein L484_009664 [Morus notabilis]